MIAVQDNYLTHNEINHLMDLWNENIALFTEPIISFYSIDLMTNDFDISSIQNNVFDRKYFHKMRLQKYNESIDQIKDFHGHENINNYIIFLNDDFTGGELEFENGLFVKPKKGTLIYFNNNEKHRVRNCVGDRYVFTCLGDIQVDIKWQIRKKNII